MNNIGHGVKRMVDKYGEALSLIRSSLGLKGRCE